MSFSTCLWSIEIYHISIYACCLSLTKLFSQFFRSQVRFGCLHQNNARYRCLAAGQTETLSPLANQYSFQFVLPSVNIMNPTIGERTQNLDWAECSFSVFNMRIWKSAKIPMFGIIDVWRVKEFCAFDFSSCHLFSYNLDIENWCRNHTIDFFVVLKKNIY